MFSDMVGRDFDGASRRLRPWVAAVMTSDDVGSKCVSAGELQQTSGLTETGRDTPSRETGRDLGFRFAVGLRQQQGNGTTRAQRGHSVAMGGAREIMPRL